MAKRSEPDLILLAFELVAERGWAGSARPSSPSRRAVAGAGLCRAADRRGLARPSRPPAGRADAGSAAGRAGRDDLARARVRAGHAPAGRHGALQGRELRALARAAPRDPALLVMALCNLDRLGAGCSTPPKPAGGWSTASRARCWARSTCVFVVWLDDDAGPGPDPGETRSPPGAGRARGRMGPRSAPRWRRDGQRPRSLLSDRRGPVFK